MKKQYALIDILKCVMALLVLIIHRPLFPDRMEFAKYMSENVICSCAVPFFFMVSAFFLFRKLDMTPSDNKKFFAFEKRIFILYALWSVIYIPCAFVKDYTGHYDEITLRSLVGEALLMLKRFIFESSFVHLWYLNSLMLGVLIVFLLLKKLSKEKTLAICAGLFVLARIFMSAKIFENAVSHIPSLFMNTFSQSLICVSLGMFAAKKEFSLKVSKCAAISSAVFLMLIISGAAAYFYRTAFDSVRYAFAVLFSFTLLILSLNADIKYRSVYRKMRDYSILIYLSQLLLMSEGYRFIALKTGISAFENVKILQFFTTLILSAAFSFAVLHLKDKKGFGFLKYLY